MLLNSEMINNTFSHFIQPECFRTVIGKPTGKRSLGRARRGWEVNTRMDLKK